MVLRAANFPSEREISPSERHRRSSEHHRCPSLGHSSRPDREISLSAGQISRSEGHESPSEHQISPSEGQFAARRGNFAMTDRARRRSATGRDGLERVSLVRPAPRRRARPGRRNDRLAPARLVADDPMRTSTGRDSTPQSGHACHQAGSSCSYSQTLNRTVFASRSSRWAT